MAYCTEADVEGTTGLNIDANSQPNTTEAAQIIANVSAEMDGVLKAAGYDAPITSGDNDLALLKHYATLGSSYQIWHATEFITESFDKVKSWETDYRNFLMRIKQHKQMLIDNPPAADYPDSITTKRGSVRPDRVDGYSS